MIGVGLRCVRCGGGPVEASADEAERLRCFQCGWRGYADSFPRCGTGRFRILLPYIGGTHDRRLKALAADILGNARGGRGSRLLLRVHCPLCPESPKIMSCVNATRQYWHCPDGHTIMLECRGGEYAGWM